MLDTEFRVKPFAWLRRAWAFPALLVALFLGFLLIVQVPWSEPSVADWVQTLGTLLAVFGAAAFPYMHESSRARAKAEGLRKVLLLLAYQQRVDLDNLCQALQRSINELDGESVSEYMEYGWHLKWLPFIEALRAIPIAELDPRQVFFIGEMKVAAAVANDVVSRLPEWNPIGDREMADMSRLEAYCDTALEAIKTFEQYAV